jgi:phenylalanine-4-hydroxylase
MKQEYSNYNEEDLLVWQTLFDRQKQNLQDKACVEYITALDEMIEVLNHEEVPSFEKLNTWFSTRTGWKIHCVPGLIPVDEFFELLAQKKFSSSTWLRSMKQLDYLEEPDMFHDIFGHVPLLFNDVFSSFMERFGKLGVRFRHDEQKLIQLQRLYWFTIEFGLINQNGLKIYGAGIASSFGESNSSLHGPAIKVDYDLDEVLNQFFKNDEVQNKYFVIQNFEELFESITRLTEAWG